MTAATSATAAASAATSSAAVAAARTVAGDMQTFLRLLTTQLRNQDPTQPLDPNEFTAQLAQFAGVEQQIATNAHMEALLGLQRSTALVAATPMVGRQVEVASDRLQLAGGQAQAVRLPALAAASGATRARIAIAGADGTVLREQVVTLGGAAGSWSWDGRDSRGRSLPDGSYALSVSGIDREGTTRGALPAVVAGTVTGVSQDGAALRLAVGGLTTGFEALRRVE